jgi:hypothetical protein
VSSVCGSADQIVADGKCTHDLAHQVAPASIVTEATSSDRYRMRSVSLLGVNETHVWVNATLFGLRAWPVTLYTAIEGKYQTWTEWKFLSSLLLLATSFHTNGPWALGRCPPDPVLSLFPSRSTSRHPSVPGRPASRLNGGVQFGPAYYRSQN